MPRHAPFGDSTPYAEPAWVRLSRASSPPIGAGVSSSWPDAARLCVQSRGEASPYYNATHVAWRARVRAFVDARVIPFCDEWDESGYPQELHREARAKHQAAWLRALRDNAGLRWLRFACA